jgi:phosphatidylinositol alpha-mannosyltransferase
MKRLRIAMFMSSHPAKAGGVQEHILYLSREMKKRGHRVTLFGPKPSKNIFTHYKVMGEKIYLPLPGDNDGNIHVLYEKDKPEEVFTQTKFDILHIHEPYMPLAAWTVLDKARLPVVGTFHTSWDDDSLLNVLNGFMPLFKDTFSSRNHSAIFVSDATRKKWIDLCSSAMLKEVIPNAVDGNEFYPKQSINKKIELLYVARLVARKGIDKLLESVLILQKNKVDFHLTIIGGGVKASYVRDFIRIHSLKHIVTYLGELRGADRLPYFHKADVFCAPYINEAAPIAILEAISSGLPIVGFRNNSFSEILSDYPFKELLVKKDPKDLAHALEQLIENPSKIQTIKKWCIDKRSSFSWTRIADRTEEMYYKTIERYHHEKAHI